MPTKMTMVYAPMYLCFTRQYQSDIGETVGIKAEGTHLKLLKHSTLDRHVEQTRCTCYINTVGMADYKVGK